MYTTVLFVECTVYIQFAKNYIPVLFNYYD